MKQNIRKDHRLIIGFVVLFLIVFSFSSPGQQSQNLLSTQFVTSEINNENFVLSEPGISAPLLVDANDYPGVIRIAKYLQNDIYEVTKKKPRLIMGELSGGNDLIIIGTIGKSKWINELIEKGKINVDDIAGKWETSLIQVLENPFPNIGKALVIVGSDKRGTIFGMFDLSRQIGVSPWHFWSDVPIKYQENIYVKNGRYNLGTPKVKYRGIFLNDEEPALGRWAVENYGGFNHLFYERVFELILRLKGNYLWPAMWWAAFNSNDPMNPILADEMGIVMGTTHHEPLNRAHSEWKAEGEGAWNYETNTKRLQQFWTEGIERMGDKETIVTLAMRGDGDRAMSPETNTALLEKIVADQRQIIGDVTGKEITKTPQLWALYKEVQDYYDRGMRVPDDVTLLLCDDNWGNIRKLPKPDELARAGGYGIYYHFDYVGGPRNYKWLNTSPLPRIWEQMNLAYRHGVDQIWIVNVGDLKPMELPISFFLDFAFDPDAWPAESLNKYTKLWAKEQFGSEHAEEIAEMLRLYTKYNSRRKPELLSPQTYSLVNFREAETIKNDYKNLAEQASKLYKKMPENKRASFYQLVLHPIVACSNLNDLYITTAQNHLAVKQGRKSTNSLSEKVKELYLKDSLITEYYHTDLSKGKWNHMMSQTHIGYTYWQQPRINSMPKVETIEVPEKAEMGVSVEGSNQFWTENEADILLPEINSISDQSVYFEIFNRGEKPFDFRVEIENVDWVNVDTKKGTIADEKRIWVSVDWEKASVGSTQVPIHILANGKKVTLFALVRKPVVMEEEIKNTFVETNGYLAIEAEHFTRKTETESIKWNRIPGLGRTLGAVSTIPVTANPVVPTGESPRLEYDIYLFEKGAIEISVLLSPTLNYFNDEGRKLAVSIDDEAPQIINIHKDSNNQTWEKWVSNNCIEAVSSHEVKNAGKHTVKIWMVNSGLVIQKLIVRAGEKKESYLGPPESYFVN